MKVLEKYVINTGTVHESDVLSNRSTVVLEAN